MTQIAMKDAAVLGTFVVHGRRQRLQDQLFRWATLFFALLVLALLGGVILALVVGAWPALGTFGIGFLFTEVWNPVTEKWGGQAPV
jgi:phosphate transport system permease protein